MANELEQLRRSQLAEATDMSLSQHMLNEVYVVGHGISGSFAGVKDAAVRAWENPGSTTLQIGIGTAVGLGIGYFSGKAGIYGLAARGLAAAAGLSFLDEGVKPWREALSRGWSATTDAELNAASAQLSTKLGQFAFDTAIMTPGAVAGTIAGSRLSLKVGELKTTVALETLRKAPAADLKATGAPAALVEGPKTAARVEATATNPGDAVVEAVRPERTGNKPLRFIQVEPGSPNNRRFDFGIEISDPSLLKGQRNLDHHRTTDGADILSATEQALKLPDHLMPKPGSTLGTIRADADSLTAMAVLANRNEGRAVNARLAEAIGRADRGLKEPPAGENYSDLKDMIAAIHHTARSHLDFHRKVFFVKDCLDGSVNRELVDTLARRSRDIKRNLHEEIRASLKVDQVIPGKLAFVESFSSSALFHGYDYAPVVVLFNRNNNFTRFSVGTQSGSSEGKYLARAIRELRGLEPGWGGRETIFGSPQNTNTKLTPEQVLDVVKKYIDPPAYKRYWWETVDYLRESRPFKWFVSND